MTALAVRATDYNVPITVVVNGESSEQTGIITIVENNGLYDLTLKNFVLQSSDAPMGVGNVELRGIKAWQDGNATLLMANDQVTITNGDDPSVGFWMASMLPPVPVELRGKIEGERLRCFIDIDLMESLGQIIQVVIGNGYQLPNQSFEAWHTSTESYVEPNAWHSFETATGLLAPLAGHHIDKSDDAHSGKTSARIFATSIFGIVANGTMTTGRMNAGSMTAANTSNNAYLDMSKEDVDGNGDPFYVSLCSRPDSVAVWVKFKQGVANAQHPYATISAVITDGTYYQDPEDKAYTNVVAKAKNNTIATTNGQWVRVTAPFVYTENAVEPKAVLVTLSTNADAGQGSDGGRSGAWSIAGGGGGAGAKGGAGNHVGRISGGGGDGVPLDITGETVWYAGGGGGGGAVDDWTSIGPAPGGQGGGGNGARKGGGNNEVTVYGDEDGVDGLGGGGGGGAGGGSACKRWGHRGGSGVAIVRFVSVAEPTPVVEDVSVTAVPRGALVSGTVRSVGAGTAVDVSIAFDPDELGGAAAVARGLRAGEAFSFVVNGLAASTIKAKRAKRSSRSPTRRRRRRPSPWPSPATAASSSWAAAARAAGRPAAAAAAAA